MTQRFVKTQREMEGRFEDVWALVDEDDDLETWPEDAELDVVGKPATAPGRPARARAARPATRSTSRCPGCSTPASLRAPVARCRVTRLDLDAARATPGVRAVLGPEGPFTMSGARVLTAEPSWAGEPIAAVAADTPEAAAAGARRAGARLRGARRRSTPTGGLDEQRFTEDPRETVRGDPDAALAAAEVRGRAHLRDAGARADAARAARGRRALGRRRADGVGLDAGDVRRAPRARAPLRPRPPSRCA